MYTVRNITEDLYWVGANDHRLHLFENIHPIPRGVSYNSYLLMDEKTVLFDTVDWAVCREFLNNIEHVLDGKDLDYIIINHLEPDHAASLDEVLMRYPNAKVISNERAFMMMRQFGFAIDGKEIEVAEGDAMSFGKHEITWVAAPMVHWPEAMVSFDTTNGVLFSADAFGTFGALDGKLFADEVNFDRDWLDDARRYLTNIVGKYGSFVQDLLKKASTIDIKMICPLHGPVWREDLGYFIDKYDKWSRYEPEEEGVLIVYASMYGNTEYAAQTLATKLCKRGMTNVQMYDVSDTHVSYLVSEAFKYSHIVLASVTYNLEMYPVMHNFLNEIRMLNLQNRTVGIIENGSWAPQAAGEMEEFLDEKMKLMDVLSGEVSIASSLNDSTDKELEGLADAIMDSFEKIREDKKNA
ncbi:H(2)O-forming NADH oxidase [Aedoeadaptatus ivorii]|uniref:H(2)O-forming NADH oxidase n=1 Tax=Aedoeadaptatus ivorii TaxID=54006 RepID=A0A448UZQ3_9FIRM|nr:FprA family A-type flavoprotein [Peptoniphilus ivorii]MDQ0508580.1 flavorubredoxin [Peptoniphilus ivorii]VEJ34475.1 H(2)O-forming NADH oxidase [Peptoniphilus ivorii]